MNVLFFSLLVLTSCAATSQTIEEPTKAFSSFSHLQKKTAKPFPSTFLNPVFAVEKNRKKSISISSKGPLQSTAYIWFIAYHETLSRMDGSTCNFSPTCSGFALQAISKYGPLGFGMAFGRLHKNHLDRTFYLEANDQGRLSDPLMNYTFWLQTPKRDNFAAHTDPAHAWFQHVSLVNE